MGSSDDKKSVASQKTNHKQKRKLSIDDSSLNYENDSVKKRAVSSKKGRKSRYDPELEARLEREVFGDATDVIQNLLREENYEPIKKEEIPSVTTRTDDSESDSNFYISDSDDQEECDFDISDSKHIKGKAWIDEDDDKYSVDKAFNAQKRKLPEGRPENKYSELLRNKFSNIFGSPKWADLKKEEDADSEESDSEVLKHSSHKVAPKSKKLRKGTIELKALRDINRKTHNEGPYVTSVQFHPTSTVGLVAGSSGVLSLFEIDGRENNKLHSLKFKKFPISAAHFLKEGTQIVAGSLSHAHCFTYDLMSGNTRKTALPHGITNMKKFEVSPDEKYLAICGRLGEIHVLSSITKELIRTFKMNKKCNALAFTPDSQKLITHGESTEMYVWDIRNQSCMHRAIDDGCLSAASIAISASGQFLATGSKQGVVNVYDTNTVLQKKSPTPLKILLNLVTSITSLKFNPTSEMLAVASSKKANAFKLMHLPSFTVFSNFPTFQTKMYNPLAIDFSPGSGFLSVANNKNHAYLYRLKHYGNY